MRPPRSLRTLVVVLPLAVVVAGCTHSGEDLSKYERALREHAVVNLGAYGLVEEVECRLTDPDRDTRSTQDVQCEIDLVAGRWPRWAACNDDEQPGAIVCWGADAPADSPVFGTRAWLRAPKSVVWKCEDVDGLGRGIGPVYVALRDDPTAPIRVLEWQTTVEAESVARANGVTLDVDC